MVYNFVAELLSQPLIGQPVRNTASDWSRIWDTASDWSTDSTQGVSGLQKDSAVLGWIAKLLRGLRSDRSAHWNGTTPAFREKAGLWHEAFMSFILLCLTSFDVPYDIVDLRWLIGISITARQDGLSPVAGPEHLDWGGQMGDMQLGVAMA